MASSARGELGGSDLEQAGCCCCHPALAPKISKGQLQGAFPPRLLPAIGSLQLLITKKMGANLACLFLFCYASNPLIAFIKQGDSVLLCLQYNLTY